MEEIEELKKAGSGSGKEIIAKIMASHQAIDEKTSFSLAKYTLRKSRKYLKRFTVLPVDVGTLAEFLTEREAFKVQHLREETLGLINSWANIHCGEASEYATGEDGISQIGGGRWLVVDDTGGLVVAALAEKMGILYPEEEGEGSSAEEENEDVLESARETGHENGTVAKLNDDAPTNGIPKKLATLEKEGQKLSQSANGSTEATENKQRNGIDAPALSEDPQPQSTDPSSISDLPPRPRKALRPHIPQMSSSKNTITLLQPNNQPNLAHLRYFGYDSGKPSDHHPLYTHLKTLSWLQLLYPHQDPSYIEPEVISEEALAGMKSSKRGTYYKKRRRWEKAKRVVDETRGGGFDGLVVASVMEPRTILKELVPLVRGGGRVVVYSPNVEPLVELCDLYSKERRTAYVNKQTEIKAEGDTEAKKEDKEEDIEEEDEDFPLNPTLLLAPSLQTARARHWQVLPSRTHPMMTSRGGAEGYLFTATRVLPIEGKVEARGHWRGGKKRKTGMDTAVSA
jgi:tRNA (adenine-N(1)-)-methyltransferase non-catalytic subunit